MRELNEALASVTDDYSLACECADTACFRMATVDGYVVVETQEAAGALATELAARE